MQEVEYKWYNMADVKPWEVLLISKTPYYDSTSVNGVRIYDTTPKFIVYFKDTSTYDIDCMWHSISNPQEWLFENNEGSEEFENIMWHPIPKLPEE